MATELSQFVDQSLHSLSVKVYRNQVFKLLMQKTGLKSFTGNLNSAFVRSFAMAAAEAFY